jgi:hypothetical protein
MSWRNGFGDDDVVVGVEAEKTPASAEFALAFWVSFHPTRGARRSKTNF